jgi:hypothetical protein
MILKLGDTGFMMKRQRLRNVGVCTALCAPLVFAVACLAGTAGADPSLRLMERAAMAVAQSSAPSQQAPATQQNNQQSDTNHEEQTGTSNDRLFYAMPNFLTIQSSNQLPPLSVKQKFKVVAQSAFDYFEYPWYGALAGISQAENSEPAYGQGAEGYAKRYGAAFADGTIENFWTSAILPSVLHQDPRFYQMPTGGFTHRAVYAGSRILITRSDSGRRQFNFSEIFGSLIAAAISTYSYHPRSERTIGDTASVWGSEVGYDTITIEVKEFWPDIHRKFSHKATNDPAAASQP